MELLGLPEEVLDEIVSAGIQSNFGKYQYDLLKTLRQVCKRFSRLHCVNSHLFRAIRLIATQRHLLRESELVISGIDKHVKHITFVQPVHVEMDYKSFVAMSKDRRSAIHRNFRSNSGKPCETYEAEMDRITVDDFREGHNRYAAAAMQSSHFISDERAMESAFVPLLTRMTRCVSFRFAAVDYSFIDLNLNPMVPLCISSTRHPYELRCDHRLSAEIADTFIQRAIVCMSEAKCAPESLHFGQAHNPSGALTWRERYGLDALDCSEMVNLVVDPRLPDDPVWDGDEDGHVRALRADLRGLLDSCGATLQRLECRPHGTAWFTDHLPKLPQLRTLLLGSCETSSATLCAWLQKLPNLEGIETKQYMHLCVGSAAVQNDPEDVQNWMLVFDALRDHQTLKYGHIETMIQTQEVLVSFNKEEPLKDWYVDDTMTYYGLELPYFKRRYAELLDLVNRRTALEEWLERERKDAVETWIGFYVCGKISRLDLERFF